MKPAYVGIDYKANELSVSIVGPSELVHVSTTRPLTKLVESPLIWMLPNATAAAEKVADIMEQRDMYGALCVVEQPAGKFIPRKLLMTEGVLIATFGQKFATVDVPVMTWRKAVLGKGNCTKEDAVAYVKERYGVELIHDEAEAVCLGVYGMENSE